MSVFSGKLRMVRFLETIICQIISDWLVSDLGTGTESPELVPEKYRKSGIMKSKAAREFSDIPGR